jgi:SAM-dependent methyltransferase
MSGADAQGDAGRRSSEAVAGAGGYLLAGQASELERLQLQSRVWEPSGRRLLEEIGDGGGARVLDVGCGALGWLRILSEWVGADGAVTGMDFDEAMLRAADEFVAEEGLRNVRLVKDDLFASELEPHAFDLVHARFEITPLGRASEQMETYVRLARPAGTIVLEDPDPGSWLFNPPAPALERLIELTIEAFRASGGDWGAARQHLHLLREFAIEGSVRADVVALPPGTVPRSPTPVRDRARVPIARGGDGGRARRTADERRVRASGRGALGHYLHASPVLGSNSFVAGESPAFGPEPTANCHAPGPGSGRQASPERGNVSAATSADSLGHRSPPSVDQ